MQQCSSETLLIAYDIKEVRKLVIIILIVVPVDSGSG